MAGGLAFDQSNIFILVLETFVYGIFLPLFLISLWILGRAARNVTVFQKMMMVTVTLMFLISTAHLIVSVMRAFDAFTSGGMGVLYYLNISDKKQTLANALYVAQTFIGDAFIISRLYIVWDKSLLVIVFPICLLFGWLSVATITSFKFVHSTPEDTFATFQNWVIADFTLTLATSITCTFLISWKIWRTHRRGRQVGLSSSSRLIPVIYAIVESAAIYSAAVLSILIVYLSNSENGGYIEILTPLIGVVFSLIVVQVHLRHMKQQGSSMMPSRLTALSFVPGTGSGTSSNPNHIQSLGSPSTMYHSDVHPMSPLSSKFKNSNWEKREDREESYPRAV